MNLSKIGRVRNDGRWHSRGSDWATPHELFNSLNAEFNFTLDVCASEWNKKCDKYFNEQQDGLKQDWGNNICWMKSPHRLTHILILFSGDHAYRCSLQHIPAKRLHWMKLWLQRVASGISIWAGDAASATRQPW